MRHLLLAALFLPVIGALAAPDSVRSVLDSGAVGDGTTLNTGALQEKAIDTCSAAGGGTLTFPAGRYLTGTIQLKDRVTLHLDAGAVILGSTNAADYRNADPFINGVGQEMGYALIVTVGARQVGIEGAGAIDGQGAAVKAAQEKYTIRPFLVRWVRCTDVAVKDVSLVNSGAWTMHFFQCQNVAAERLTIRSLGLANNDGIDTDSCEFVSIRDCDINTGDDAICLKATSPAPCRNVTVTGCKLQTRCNAIKLGTESIGDFEHIRISNCQIHDTMLSGIALNSVDGALLHNVVLSDITMDGITVPITMRLGARLKTFRTGDQPKPPGVLRDITIKNVRATRAQRIGMLINGIPGHPVENLTLENVDLALPGGGTAEDAKLQLLEKESAYPEWNMFGKVLPAYGLYLRHVRGVTFKNVRISVAAPDARPEKIFLDVEGVSPADMAPVATTPAASVAAQTPPPADATRVSSQPPTVRTDLRLTDFYLHDPWILAEKSTQTYYLYTSAATRRTGQNRTGTFAYKSKDLVTWEGPFLVFVCPDDSWADPQANAWAPEVHAYQGKYYLFTTLHNSKKPLPTLVPSRPNLMRGTMIAVSDSPEGPFTLIKKDGPVTPPDFMTLDGTLYVDPAGQPWMVYAHEWLQKIDGTIEALPLKPDLSAAAGSPIFLLKGSDAPWLDEQAVPSAKSALYVTDGPEFFRTKTGRLLMLWSSYERNSFGLDGYVETIARSKSGELKGPWEQLPPLVRNDSGHGMLFRTFAGQLMLVLHQPFVNARAKIYEMEDLGDNLRVVKYREDLSGPPLGPQQGQMPQ